MKILAVLVDALVDCMKLVPVVSDYWGMVNRVEPMVQGYSLAKLLSIGGDLGGSFITIMLRHPHSCAS